VLRARIAEYAAAIRVAGDDDVAHAHEGKERLFKAEKEKGNKKKILHAEYKLRCSDPEQQS
jgi:hypothetical protein